MAKQCALFWDIQDADVPKGQTVASIVDLIRSTIVEPFNLILTFYFCDCDELSLNVYRLLRNHFIQAYKGINIESDTKEIKESMKKFVEGAGQECTIILLGGDADYYGTLSDLKNLHNVSIHLIRLAHSFTTELDEISDYTFMLNDGVLKPIKSTGLPQYFISIQNYPLSLDMSQVMNELNAQTFGSIGNSAILYGDLICLGFPTLWSAEKAIEKVNGFLFKEIFLKAELILKDSPLTEILKCLKPNVDIQTKSNNEVKQLTFIKINNSNEADQKQIIKYCITSTAILSGSQCIYSNHNESFLWIAFSLKSDAQNCLPEVKNYYPDAVLIESPIGSTLNCLNNSFSVESCEEIVETEGFSSDLGLNDGCNDNDWKIFFRFNYDLIARMIDYKPPNWTLLYDLFEKLYDLGAIKVIFDGKVYCVHFDSASDYQDAFERIRSRYLEPLESMCVQETHKQEVVQKMNRYTTGIPWCFNEQLDLYCLVIKIQSLLHDQFMEIGKNILGNRECIFIKSTPGEIWIGFPDKFICENSKRRVDKIIANLTQFYKDDPLENITIQESSNVSVSKPSKELLESIDFRDLAGDAYDLAFLSSQLYGTKPEKQIIKQIRLQRMQEQAAGFYFSADGVFGSRWDLSDPGPYRALNFFDEDKDLSLEQIVKIFTKLSKVIPLVATASYYDVNLIYSSWHEAHAARHFIKKLTAAEVPYFRRFNGANSVRQLEYLDTSKTSYYIINDKRKVLEKIVKNKNQVEKLDSNSSSFQSTSDIDVLDEEMTKKLQYLFVIKIDSDCKFTSGMILMIENKLRLSEYSAWIEFEDKIWVGFANLARGDSAKFDIERMKFKFLHENDADDFEIRVIMNHIEKSPPEVTKMLANKLMNPKMSPDTDPNPNCGFFPLGHFNYSYRKAVGISTSRYFQYDMILTADSEHSDSD